MNVLGRQTAGDCRIRPLTGADARAVVALRRAIMASDPSTFSMSPSEEEAVGSDALTRVLDDCHQAVDREVWGAFLPPMEHGEDLVGMVGIDRFQADYLGHKARLWGLGVRRPFRRNALGRRLMETAIAFARQLGGVEVILLSVTSDAHAALDLYYQLGFQQHGHERRAIKTPTAYLDEYQLHLDLTPSASSR